MTHKPEYELHILEHEILKKSIIHLIECIVGYGLPFLNFTNFIKDINTIESQFKMKYHLYYQ